MLVKILGGVDVLAGLALLVEIGNFVPTTILIALGTAMFAKAFMGFPTDVGGWMDMITSLSLFASIFFSLNGIVLVIVAIMVLQKGLLSFL